jgi:hypothetical protein
MSVNAAPRTRRACIGRRLRPRSLTWRAPGEGNEFGCAQQPDEKARALDGVLGTEYAALDRASDAKLDQDERTRTSTELPPHGPEPNRGPVDASWGVRYVQIAAFWRRI